MDYEFKDEPTPTRQFDGRDVVISYMDTAGDHNHGNRTIARYIEADVTENNDEVIVEIEAIDNINGGVGMFGSITDDLPGGEKVEFSDEIRIDKREVESRKPDDLPELMSTSELVMRDIKEWSQNAEFRAEPKKIPEGFRYE